MKKLASTDSLHDKAYKRRSLRFTLITSFLLVALFPLLIVSWFSYYQAKNDLTHVAKEKLGQSASLSVDFITSWFDYRVMDVNSQAELHSNVTLLNYLTTGYKNSNKNLANYVKSFDWVKRVDAVPNNLIKLSRQYDYIYDLYLIDNLGNIIYSVGRKSDLGTNIISGPYLQSKFSLAVENTQRTGEVVFSGLERYAPSNNTITGFITAPLLNEYGEKLGVFAMQLSFDRIFTLLNHSKANTTLVHYLVAQDGSLRTPYRKNNWEDVLNSEIKIKYKAHKIMKNDPSELDSYQYIGPNNKSVIGTHQAVRLGNITWHLASEINTEEALSSVEWLGKLIFTLALLSFIPVIIISIYMSRRITQPIRELAAVSMSVAAGDTEQFVEIHTNDEIGQLAKAFNYMLEMRKIHEMALEQSTKQSLEALDELAEQKFAIDQHSIVAVTDIKGTITDVNEKFCEISGYSRSELVGFNHRILNSGYHNTAFFRHMFKTIASGNVWHGEVCNQTMDGNEYWVDTTIVPFMNENNKPKSYIAIRTDITESKLAESALIEARNIAEEAAQSKSEFLASMSHEIRTPMNGVLGMLGLLKQSDLDEKQSYRLKIAQNSAESLLMLINDILDFSKIEANKLELEILDFNLRSMLGDFVESLAYQAQQKGLELSLNMTGVEHSMVQGDPGRIRQILTNIVSNAIKFTSQGEILINVTLTECGDEQMQFNCKISDTGIGIPAEKIADLFTSFSQVDTSTTRKYGGTGLGLAIVKKLCKLMNGDVFVNSVYNEGSTFEVTIMLKASAQSEIVLPKYDISKLHILVVDDNAVNREVLTEQLQHWGASVTEAVSAMEALQMCQHRIDANTRIFDIALLDMQMPEMDGINLSKALRAVKQYSAMKLVMMTSMGHQGDAHFFAGLGFSAYFPKPATTSDLFNALAVVADDGQALEQATPLVTHNYLNTLKSSDDEINTDQEEFSWPASMRILLVEDNQVNQLVAKGILGEFGINIDIAANGHEAIACLQQAPEDAPYTLVLMDCQMPEMDGYEASRQIRAVKAGERNKAIPIIAMTANTMQGDKEACLKAGMDDYLAKPIDPQKLIKKIQKWVPESVHGQAAINIPSNTDNSEILPIELLHSQAQAQAQAQAQKNDEMPIWDQGAALQRLMNNESLLSMLLNTYIEETPARLEALQQAIDENDFEQIQMIAHALKGMVANLSGLRVQSIAGVMETAGREHVSDNIMQTMSNLQLASQELSDCFGIYINGANQEASGIEIAELLDTLQGLSTKLRENDLVDPEFLDSLRSAAVEQSVKRLLNNLCEQIIQFDNEVALTTIIQIELKLSIYGVNAEPKEARR